MATPITKLDQPRIVVFGAAGNTGREVVRALAARNVQVRVTDADEQRLRTLHGDHTEVVVANLSSPREARAAVDGADIVYLLTANSPEQKEQERNALDAAIGAGVHRIVRHSAAGADPASQQLILRWHGEMDLELSRSGLKHTIIRPYWFMQNLFWFIQPGRREFVLPMGDAAVAAVDVRDVARVAAAALCSDEWDGQVLPVSGPEAVTFHDVASELSAALGQARRYVPVDPLIFRKGLESNGVTEWSAAALTDLFANVVGAGMQATAAPTVRQITGRDPIAVAQFVREHALSFAGPDSQVQNLEIIRRWYERPGPEYLSPDISWTLVKGFPVDGTFHGPREVFDAWWPQLMDKFSEWKPVATQLLPSGDSVIGIGYYEGVAKGTAIRFRASFAHVWTLRDGKIAGMYHCADTLTLANALDSVAR